MPSCRLETSRRMAEGLAAERLFADLHQVLIQEAGAQSFDCKSRLVVADAVFVGDGSPSYDMVHLEIGLLPGRSPQVKTAVGERALAVLQRQFEKAAEGLKVQFTVQVKEMPRETYFKAVCG